MSLVAEKLTISHSVMRYPTNSTAALAFVFFLSLGIIWIHTTISVIYIPCQFAWKLWELNACEIRTLLCDFMETEQ